MILAVDPGTHKSAYVLLDEAGVPCESAIIDNGGVMIEIENNWKFETQEFAIEGIECFGMPVGKETFETCIWIGRFIQAYGAERATIVYRSKVKQHLCRNVRARDPHIWQALVDRFGPGKAKAVGVKKQPGPLHGITSHCRSALAVGVTYFDTRK